ncbi:uncharacterized protein J8A68_000207 [[Candida] subhashii]|uniref:BZIP domain-containing protein n=1 Tax=[Candida] subhashii TaxID=561895 RepID=A0A8J5QIK7_9ASCO|nr:uncharacterized protein J8A68_000207 [[Candida] subhashii]KAG7666254.1 hypothetical protein J8A68_000207 [[Candida] subhashii]
MTEETSSALLEQLVYIDNYMNGGGGASESSNATPNLDIDGQLSLDLAAFADDSFIFPDEEKPIKREREDDDEHEDNRGFGNSSNSHHHIHDNWNINPGIHAHPGPSIFNNNNLHNNNNHTGNAFDGLPIDNLVNNLPKFPVPPGAKSSLQSAGLSQNQIDLLSALVAQHQTSLGNSIPPTTAAAASSANTIVPTPMSSTSSSVSSAFSPPAHSPIRQHSQLFINEDNMGGAGMTPTSTMSGSSSFTSTPDPSDLDKRRRNTAASARFRIKKKMKEKEMESRISNLTDTIGNLENKLAQLEMENKLLRNLILEKGSQKGDDEVKLLRERAKRG